MKEGLMGKSSAVLEKKKGGSNAVMRLAGKPRAISFMAEKNPSSAGIRMIIGEQVRTTHLAERAIDQACRQTYVKGKVELAMFTAEELGFPTTLDQAHKRVQAFFEKYNLAFCESLDAPQSVKQSKSLALHVFFLEKDSAQAFCIKDDAKGPTLDLAYNDFLNPLPEGFAVVVRYRVGSS